MLKFSFFLQYLINVSPASSHSGSIFSLTGAIKYIYFFCMVLSDLYFINFSHIWKIYMNRFNLQINMIYKTPHHIGNPHLKPTKLCVFFFNQFTWNGHILYTQITLYKTLLNLIGLFADIPPVREHLYT